MRSNVSRKLSLFWLIGVGSALVYGAILSRLPLFTTVTSAKRNLNNISAAEWPLGVVVIGCILIVFGGYALGGTLVESISKQRTARFMLVGFPCLFALLLVFTFPMTSTDVYDYLFRGWMLANYHTNPFVAPPIAFPDDPLLPYVGWPWAVSAYGPLWERMSWVTAWMSGLLTGEATPDVRLLRLVLGYKVLSVIAYGLGGAVTWLALGGAFARWRWLGLYAWLWNPLVLWETIGAAHNDVWLALSLMLALWALRVWPEHHNQTDWAQRLSPGFGVVALTAGGLVKFVAFFFGPVALAAVISATPGWRARLRIIAWSGTACLALAALAYAPFWVGLDTFRNVGDRKAMYTASWLAVIHPLLRNGAGTDAANSITSLLSLALLGLGVAYATWRVWRDPPVVEAAMVSLMLWFLLVCNPWFQPWYLVWLAGLAALMPWWQRMQWVVGVFCLTSLASYIINGLVLPALHLDQPPYVRELLISIFVYIPPMLILLWPQRQKYAKVVAPGSLAS